MHRCRASHALIAFAALGITLLDSSASPAATPPERREFKFTYVFEVLSIPPGAKQIAIWVPYPSESEFQEIGSVFNAFLFFSERREEPKYGNKILFMKGPIPDNRIVKIDIQFPVERRAYRELPSSPPKSARRMTPADLQPWLEQQPGSQLSPDVAAQAVKLTDAFATAQEKARALYDFVKNQKSSDVTGLVPLSDFISLCRAVGIPARVVGGFRLPEAHGKGSLSRYHCWGEFFTRESGWVPIDLEDGSFASLSADRLELSVGRGINLDPPQSGGPLDLFVYPYVEVDGKPHGRLRAGFSYTDRVAR